MGCIEGGAFLQHAPTRGTTMFMECPKKRKICSFSLDGCAAGPARGAATIRKVRVDGTGPDRRCWASRRSGHGPSSNALACANVTGRHGWMPLLRGFLAGRRTAALSGSPVVPDGGRIAAAGTIYCYPIPASTEGGVSVPALRQHRAVPAAAAAAAAPPPSPPMAGARDSRAGAWMSRQQRRPTTWARL